VPSFPRSMKYLFRLVLSGGAHRRKQDMSHQFVIGVEVWARRRTGSQRMKLSSGEARNHFPGLYSTKLVTAPETEGVELAGFGHHEHLVKPPAPSSLFDCTLVVV
jgi:hypothetical protein